MSELFLMTCMECGKKFEPRNWRQRICSDECLKVRKRRRESAYYRKNHA